MRSEVGYKWTQWTDAWLHVTGTYWVQERFRPCSHGYSEQKRGPGWSYATGTDGHTGFWSRPVVFKTPLAAILLPL